MHTIITPLSETRPSNSSALNSNSTRDPFHLFRSPNENNQNNNGNSNNTNSNNNLEANRPENKNSNLGFNLENILSDRNSQNIISNRENVGNNSNNRNRNVISNAFTERPAFFGLFSDNSNIENNNLPETENNNINEKNQKNDITEVEQNDKKDGSENKNNLNISNINTINSNNPPPMQHKHLLKNENSPPFLNLNENNQSENLLGKKRENDSNVITEDINNNIEINRNLNLNNNHRNDNLNPDPSFSPILAPEIEMIIEEYTEQEDDDSRSFNNESCNYTESENNND